MTNNAGMIASIANIKKGPTTSETTPSRLPFCSVFRIDRSCWSVGAPLSKKSPVNLTAILLLTTAGPAAGGEYGFTNSSSELFVTNFLVTSQNR